MTFIIITEKIAEMQKQHLELSENLSRLKKHKLLFIQFLTIITRTPKKTD